MGVKRFMAGAVLLAALCWRCGSTGEDEGEVYPLQFLDTACEVRVGRVERIDFKDGSGEYEVSVADTGILSAAFNGEGNLLSVTAKRKGRTVLTVTDRGAGGQRAGIAVHVTDCYLGFVSAGGCTIPQLAGDRCLFFVDNAGRDFYLFEYASHAAAGTPLLQGQYRFVQEEGGISLTLAYPTGEGGTESRTYSLEGSDGVTLAALDGWLHLGWASPASPDGGMQAEGREQPAGTVRSAGPQVFILRLTDPTTGEKAQWVMDLLKMPFGIAQR